jgi:hypothetical protein
VPIGRERGIPEPLMAPALIYAALRSARLVYRELALVTAAD